MAVAQFPQQNFVPGGQLALNSMDMRNLAAALPNYQQPSFQHQYHSQMMSSQSQFQIQQAQQFADQTVQNVQPNFMHQYQQQYYASQPRQTQYQPSVYQSQSYQMPQSVNFSNQQYLQPSYGNRMAQYQGQQPRLNTAAMYGQPHPQLVRRTSSNSSLQASTLRGPPRKPKQSGHALWVGNLPPGTHIIDLKDHFSQAATNDIESVFLISKSNCAFVNYKTDASCVAAMSRFHDSRFNGVRLVCRLRRGSNSGGGTSQSSTSALLALQATVADDKPGDDPDPAQDSAEAVVDVEPEGEKVKERFFVVKSLTIEDLERSVASGVWATQAHNEEALNKAYKSAENVYLIFSANKSGEYFGYARMDSAINDETSANLEVPIRSEMSNSPTRTDLPMTIPTPPTNTAPKGRIIDDSARGTIFWEADNQEKEDEDSGNVSGEGYESAHSGANPATPQAFGKPFKIVWISTDRLPFYRTRGLRNPWNANREVKIARDGTEIEPSVARRLTSMFHRPQNQSTSPTAMRQPGIMMPQGYVTQIGQMPGNTYGRSY